MIGMIMIMIITSIQVSLTNIHVKNRCKKIPTRENGNMAKTFGTFPAYPYHSFNWNWLPLSHPTPLNMVLMTYIWLFPPGLISKCFLTKSSSEFPLGGWNTGAQIITTQSLEDIWRLYIIIIGKEIDYILDLGRRPWADWKLSVCRFFSLAPMLLRELFLKVLMFSFGFLYSDMD